MAGKRLGRSLLSSALPRIGRAALLFLLIPSVSVLVGCNDKDEGDFGVEGIRHFSNVRAAMDVDKADDFTYIFNVCNGVYHKLRSQYPCRFYYAETDAWELHLHNIEDHGLDMAVADGVDLYFMATHMRRDNGTMELLYDAKKNKWIGESTDWKLGDIDLEWLALWGCDTLNRNDFKSKGFARYSPIFHGLHLILGFWRDAWDTWTTEECGRDFAQNLLDGRTIRFSWFDGASDWAMDQETAILSAETAQTWNNGNIIWGSTTTHVDHYHKKGKVQPDIPHDKLHWLCLSVVD